MKAPDMAQARKLAEYRYVGERPRERRLTYNSGASDWHGTHFGWNGSKHLTQIRTAKAGNSELRRWDMTFGGLRSGAHVGRMYPRRWNVWRSGGRSNCGTSSR
ncbi:MAG: hypothetical protein IT458_13735 [Planctomycetes bacterium]|nr:hypothetical protein [Planctomycetota bacterium]